MRIGIIGGGPLADPQAPSGEVEGTMMLFRGAYAVLRNPSGRREVTLDDVTEASEAIMTASPLMSRPGLMGSTQGADRAPRVQSPRELPLTPTSSVDTSGAPAAPVDGTESVAQRFC